jgi:hypothetical protein
MSVVGMARIMVLLKVTNDEWRFAKVNTLASRDTEYDEYERLFHAGSIVPPGSYINVESGRTIRLDQDDVLPPSFDGHVAVYAPTPILWRDLAEVV